MIDERLRETLTFEKFISIHEAASSRDDYTLVAAFEGDHCVALMGYRILFDYVHCKHLYIDDIVTTASQRFA